MKPTRPATKNRQASRESTESTPGEKGAEKERWGDSLLSKTQHVFAKQKRGVAGGVLGGTEF